MQSHLSGEEWLFIHAIMSPVNHQDPVPDKKRCDTCGRSLEWGAQGYNELGVDEVFREGIFKCPQGCEVWTYVPRTQLWRKHPGP